MDGQRKALIIANDKYDHHGLQSLHSPAADAAALADVLGNPQIGAFDVRVVRNESSYNIAAEIENILADARPNDLLLLHFSCHGLKSESGELFFAARNTQPNRLASTAVSADFVQRCLRHSRSRSIILLLDCCYGGAFGKGVSVRAGGNVNVLDSFPPKESMGGRGRAVITASSAIEYAFEGERLASDQGAEPSAFTSALVGGLASGEADRDEDGWVSLNELYDYVFDKVREHNPNQTPSRDIEMEGELYVARSGRKRTRPIPIPPDLQAATADPNMFTRVGAISELHTRLLSDNVPAALGAYEALATIAASDIDYVAEKAKAAMREVQLKVSDLELQFGDVVQGASPPHKRIHLSGPPLAQLCRIEGSDAEINVEEGPGWLDIALNTGQAGPLNAGIAVRGPTGEAQVSIHANIVAESAESETPELLAHEGRQGELENTQKPSPDPQAAKPSAAPTSSPNWPNEQGERPGSLPPNPKASAGTAPPEPAIPDVEHMPAGVARLETPTIERRGKLHSSLVPVIGIVVVVLVIVIVLGVRGISGGSPEGGGTSAVGDFSKQGDTEFWASQDLSGNLQKLIDRFNAQHPNGKVTFHQLPPSDDEQRQQMIQNTQIRNPKMGILSMDVVWTAEFAAKGYVEALPPDVSTERMLQATVDGATYFNTLYALPATADGGMLYYRKDLLKKYGLQPPTSFDEMKAACDMIQAGENNSKLGCYAGQFNKYEGLTVNFDEAVHGAGGVVVGDDGKPDVATPEATKGLQTLTDWFTDGHIPVAAITWQEEEGRKAFQNGELIFHRNWSYVYNLAQMSDIAGKFDVAPLPGITGPGVSSLGGENFGIAKYAENKGTAMDFVKYMASPEVQKSSTLTTSLPPAVESVYSHPDVLKKFPFYPTLLKSIQTAKPRPKAVEYGDVTLAIQDAAYGALQGQTQPDAALQALQAKLQTLIK